MSRNRFIIGNFFLLLIVSIGRPVIYAITLHLFSYATLYLFYRTYRPLICAPQALPSIHSIFRERLLDF